jgi:hypothetical protein
VQQDDPVTPAATVAPQTWTVRDLRAPRQLRTGSKLDTLSRLVVDQYGPLAEPDLTKVSKIATELASDADLHPASAPAGSSGQSKGRHAVHHHPRNGGVTRPKVCTGILQRTPCRPVQDGRGALVEHYCSIRLLCQVLSHGFLQGS